MMRFMLVVFAFLAFAFFQLSGGTDFDPEQTRLSRVDTPAGTGQDAGETADLDTPVVVQTDLAASDKVSEDTLNLASAQDVQPTATPVRTLRTIPAKIIPKPDVEDAEIVSAVSEEKQTIILPSLIVDRPVITRVDFGNNADTSATASDGFDVRAVTGNSVNVRGGPGTDFSVVSRMRRGDKVEILQDPGNGWVQMRPVGGGTTGWMADFLLSNG